MSGLVIAYRDKLLPRSETFVLRHYDHLSRHRLHWAGLRRVAGGLPLGDEAVTVLNPGGVAGALAEARLRLAGGAPAFDLLLRARAPALIHAHFGKSGARILPFAQAHGIPLVVSFHGGDATKQKHYERAWRPGAVFARRLEALKRRTALFLTDSDYLGDRLRERGFPAARIATHHIGVDPDHYRPDADRPREKVVLFVGRFVEKKGLGTLLRAVAIVHRAAPDLRLVLVGDGPERATREDEARRLGLPAEFTGWLPPQAVRDWLGRAEMTVVPSQVAANGDCEGLPSVIYEAHAMGLPVVATRHSGIPEAVTHGESGLLSEERDVAGLAANLLAMHQEPDLRARCAAAGRALAETSLSSRTRAAALEDLFDQVAAGRT